MAEKGVIVADALAGESVACRDAVNTDNESNARIIQLVDKAARTVPYQTTTPLRTFEGNAIDSYDLGTLPTAISDALVDVSDAESCVAWVIVNTNGSTNTLEEIYITPLIISEDATPTVAAVLPPFRVRPVYPDPNDKNMQGSAISLGTYIFATIPHAFPTYGAKTIGFHVCCPSGDNTISVKLFAAPTSCAMKNMAIDASVANDDFGTAFCYTGI